MLKREANGQGTGGVRHTDSGSPANRVVAQLAGVELASALMDLATGATTPQYPSPLPNQPIRLLASTRRAYPRLPAGAAVSQETAYAGPR
jgi:hypothetical protein